MQFESGRMERGATRPVWRVGPGEYIVKGNDEPFYGVALWLDPPCSCRDKEFRGERFYCLHEIAARLQEMERSTMHYRVEQLTLREQRNAELTPRPRRQRERRG